MVMKTSAVRTASSVSGLGNAAERSRPNFGHRRHHHRVDFLGRSRARGAGLHPSGGVVSEQGRGHLGAAGVVHTDKQNVFAEFGDATNRYTDAKARRNYAETITRASGKTLVLSRYAETSRRRTLSPRSPRSPPHQTLTPSTTASGPAISTTMTPSAAI